MREFLILFKHDLKMLFPILNFKRKKFDVFGILCTLLLTALLSVIVVSLVLKIATGYVLVKVNKVLNETQRAVEFLNLLYCFMFVVMIFSCVRKIHSTLRIKKNKQIYLKLPIKPQTLLLSKLCAILIWTMILGFTFIVPIHTIFYIVLQPSFVFWIKTLLYIILIPLVVFGISSLLIIPYILVVDFLQNKYWLMFLLITALIVGLFILYSNFLVVVQLWLETGSIKFLFNNSFISALQNCLAWSYPANCFAYILLGEKLLWPIIIIASVIIVSIILTYFISKKLFYLTLYKDNLTHSVGKPKNSYRQSKPLSALMRKEFISVYRNPKHLFSFITIATATPVMVYCCYSLFETLILNSFGIKITFSLTLAVLLIFTVLTNTFCATNISRDGSSFLKMKSLAIKPKTILLAKVLFCGIVSSLSVIISCVLLKVLTEIELHNILICCVLALLFSFAQILISTKMDLKNVKFTATVAETEATNSKTITKIVAIGLVFALIIGFASIIFNLFSQMKIVEIPIVLSYVIPVAIASIYFIFSILYYTKSLNNHFNNLTK